MVVRYISGLLLAMMGWIEPPCSERVCLSGGSNSERGPLPLLYASVASQGICLATVFFIQGAGLGGPSLV